jgi:small neutral amino acid transporter SnatA (MarC family)
LALGITRNTVWHLASGIILLVIALAMVLGHPSASTGGHHPVQSQDPMQVAVYPLAVP